MDELLQAGTDKDAVLSSEPHDIGQRAQGHQIQHIVHPV